MNRLTGRIGREIHRRLARALQHPGRYEDTWDHLNTRADDIEALPARTRPLLLNHNVIREHFAASSDYQKINLRSVSEEEEALVSEHGYSLEYLRQNSTIDAEGELQAAGVSTGDTSPALSRAEVADLTRIRTAFQLDGLSTHSVSAICPVSGAPLTSTEGFFASAGLPVFYRFEGREVFYLAVGRPGFCYAKLYLYCPDSGLVFLLQDGTWNGPDELNQFKAFLVFHYESVISRLQSPEPARPVTMLDSSHFAHHLWNTLSAVMNVIDQGMVEQLGEVVLTDEPLGPLDAIFPELQPAGIRRLAAAELPEIALRERWFPLRLGHNLVSSELIRRLVGLAYEQCPPQQRDTMLAAGAAHFPLIWISIRLNNRTWVSQEAGIVKLARELASRFPGLALVIDGFSLPDDRPVPGEAVRNVIRQEKELVEKIRSALAPDIKVYDTVGESTLVSFAWAQQAHCYLAHHGSLQHKIGWTTDTPGVVHSNKVVLAQNLHNHATFWASEKSVAPVYLSAQDIEDVAGAAIPDKRRVTQNLGNYDFSWRVACDALLPMIEAAEARK